MFELDIPSTKQVSGAGYRVYITDQYKEGDAHFFGMLIGYLAATLTMMSASSGGLFVLGCMRAGFAGLVGYEMGYSLTEAYYAKYPSDNWYEFPDNIG